MSPPCFRCGEPVFPGEESPQGVTVIRDGITEEHAWHEECALRSVIGSVGHLRGTCSCKGGTEVDPPGMSKRQAARMAVAIWRLNGFSPPQRCS